ncbi:hypothetical protein BE04_04970 [Sorangium cellulosum]|uniref:Uncharacterized protein n=2 Tax=Sorangium cellulosum TaxID=56 RepID=A0A150Q033_SORCE|nr:hypothetical protein SCE1572_52140 [Sorangium cellulosum So0157-2]KYF61371.1 hypothetical protein BE04_04970 [Sorangium cellulosum]
MRESTPSFFAWCDESDRIDAFTEALSALVHPWRICSSLSIFSTWRDEIPVDEVAATLHAQFGTDAYAWASFGVTLSSGRALGFSSHCCGDGQLRRGASGPLGMSPFDKEELLPLRLPVGLLASAKSIEVEAAMASLVVQEDVEDLLLRLCAPGASRRVTTGGCTKLGHWGAPIEIGATYHATATEVVRDLALSWVHLHGDDKVERAAGLSMDALRARVDAAPHGARIAVKGGAEVSREAVLQAIDTAPAVLLDALEASALPDDDWRAVEPYAREVMKMIAEGAPVQDVDLTTRKHVRFLEQHAPYHVRRLPSGGVVLATHPYRTLWPLWNDALFLLGITS